VDSGDRDIADRILRAESRDDVQSFTAAWINAKSEERELPETHLRPILYRGERW
jgi:hypothetical protein